MGMIVVAVSGSFGNRIERFSAMTGGHAQAVAEAIKYLSDAELPKAIHNDHLCHADGIEPSEGFGKLGAGVVKKSPT